jgi:hypothetical protein
VLFLSPRSISQPGTEAPEIGNDVALTFRHVRIFLFANA